MLRKETVEPALLALLTRLLSVDGLSSFVLVGGTALTLRIGCRKSVDIDLFTTQPFEANQVLELLRENGFAMGVQNLSKATLMGQIDGIKVDFVRHNYPWIKPPETMEGVRLASLEDVAAMKLNAIVGSGSRLKDFVDVAFLSAHLPYATMLDCYEAKYPDINGVIATKSLTFFNDIDHSSPIEYIGKPLRWEQIERRIFDMVQKPTKVFKKL